MRLPLFSLRAARPLWPEWTAVRGKELGLKITFVLPSYLRSPCGGFRVVYELADRLAGRGHRVAVLHPRSLEPAAGPWAVLKARTWPFRARRRHPELLPWFSFDHPVELLLAPDLEPRSFPDADVVVATSWQTAARVAVLPPEKGRRLLYAMDYEHWAGAGEARKAIAAAWRQPFTRLASSPAVAAMLEGLGCAVAAVVVAPVAPEDFALDRPPEERRAVCGFPLRTESWKGARDAFAAFELLRDRRPGALEVRAFGVLAEPERPPWVDYLAQPDDRELRRFYNGLAIFLLPSRHEGWGLPALEAMACGAALVATRCGGAEAFTREGESALLVPPGQPAAMAEALARLLDDRELRLRLAQGGLAAAGRLRWNDSIDVFEACLERAP